MLEPDQQALREMTGGVSATVSVPVRQCADHHAFGVGQRSRLAESDYGEDVRPLRRWQQANNWLVADPPDRQPQAKQRCAAADQHLPRRQVAAQLAVAVRMELDRVRSDPEQPRLGVEYRRSARGGREQSVDDAGRKRHRSCLVPLVLPGRLCTRRLYPVRLCHATHLLVGAPTG